MRRTRCGCPACSKAERAFSKVPQTLVDEPQIAPGTHVVGYAQRDFLQAFASQLRLPGLQVTEREIHPRADLVRPHANDVLVDLLRARIEPEPKIDDAQQPLAFDVLGLHAQRQFELLFGPR